RRSARDVSLFGAITIAAGSEPEVRGSEADDEHSDDRQRWRGDLPHHYADEQSQCRQCQHGQDHVYQHVATPISIDFAFIHPRSQLWLSTTGPCAATAYGRLACRPPALRSASPVLPSAVEAKP